jgi:hypothetical protein
MSVRPEGKGNSTVLRGREQYDILKATQHTA